ncbi:MULTISPECIES: OmpA family protein [unclassified Myroides]|uniref:OmpA family protein n=1 Tax=unclassified Myroides TaxID=2642485 RepID=UPI003D2F86FD
MKNVLVVLFLVLAVTAQGKRKPSLKKADRYFTKMEYVKAKDEYTRLLRGRHTPNYINQQLALCYDQLGLSVQAAQFYTKALEQDPGLSVAFYYRLAYNLTKNGRYEAAAAAMYTFAHGAADDPKALYFLKHADDYPRWGKNLSTHFIEEAGINDAYYADHSLSWTTTDTLLFVSNRTKYNQKWVRKLFEAKEKGTKMPNTALYQTTLKSKDEPVFEHSLLKGRINRRFMDGQAVMHPSNKLIYFTSESYRHRKFRKNKAVKRRQGLMSLFWAERKGKKWNKITVLPFVQVGYTYVNPFVSPQGDYLYFASNQPGSIGELDLWRVSILEEGKAFGEPENLGERINTGYKEDYPFITEDEILYFTSDRWGGYGGLDIYALDLKDKQAVPQNLREGVNTPKDDFNWVYNSKRDFGFLSSNRIGRQDIYRVKPLCETVVQGMVVDIDTREALRGVKLAFVDKSRQILAEVETDEQGQFESTISCNKAYTLKFEKEGYFYKEEEYSSGKGKEEPLDIALRKQVRPEVQDNQVILNAIPFAFDQATITAVGERELDRLVDFMRENKTMRILIVAHTDHVGKEKYNQRLSEARAKATAQYLFDQGISSGRIEVKGVGSSQPKVKCDPCSPAEDQQNRRSEFHILHL